MYLKKVTKQIFKEMKKHNLIHFKRYKGDFKNYNHTKNYVFVEDEILEKYNQILSER